MAPWYGLRGAVRVPDVDGARRLVHGVCPGAAAAVSLEPVERELLVRVPAGGGRTRLRRCLRSSSSNPVVYAELPGGQHTFDLVHSLRFEAVVDAIEAFASWVRTRDTDRRPRA